MFTSINQMPPDNSENVKNPPQLKIRGLLHRDRGETIDEKGLF